MSAPTMKSTRLSIIQQALSDALGRLGELPESAQVRALRLRAGTYQRSLERWDAVAPNDAHREALLTTVLELQLEVMRLAKAGDASK